MDGPGGTAYGAVDGPGGTNYSAMDSLGGPLLGGTTYSMTELLPNIWNLNIYTLRLAYTKKSTPSIIVVIWYKYVLRLQVVCKVFGDHGSAVDECARDNRHSQQPEGVWFRGFGKYRASLGGCDCSFRDEEPPDDAGSV